MSPEEVAPPFPPVPPDDEDEEDDDPPATSPTPTKKVIKIVKKTTVVKTPIIEPGSKNLSKDEGFVGRSLFKGFGIPFPKGDLGAVRLRKPGLRVDGGVEFDEIAVMAG